MSLDMLLLDSKVIMFLNSCSDCFMFTKLMFKLEILTRIKPNNNLRPISSYQGMHSLPIKWCNDEYKPLFMKIVDRLSNVYTSQLRYH